jgi:hypothetical protein
LVDFRISEGGVCVDHKKWNISPGREDYELMRVKRENCDKSVDINYASLFEIGEDTLY